VTGIVSHGDLALPDLALPDGLGAELAWIGKTVTVAAA
jgi:hypothetical protein